MTKWTFLLQKDGDRSWLPLGAAALEVEEGRYRIVAQTEHPDTDISIRICHLATAEDPPKRRIQKRSNRTNHNGLMVVAPFTRLQPGDWEFSCFLTDPMSDLVGDMLHQAVRLQVVAAAVTSGSVSVKAPTMTTDATGAMGAADDSELAIAPETASTPVPLVTATAQPTLTLIQPEPSPAPDESSPEITLEPPAIAESQVQASDLSPATMEIAQSLGVSMDRLVAMTDQLSHQLIAEIFREFDLPAVVEPLTPEVAASEATVRSSVDPAADVASTVASQPEPIDVRRVQIVLAQDAWMAAKGESLAIAGRLDPISYLEAHDFNSPTMQDTDAALDSDLEGAIPQELHVQFRDPQTSQVLFHARQSFPSAPLPVPFHFLCQLPSDLTTHLLVGDVLIVGVLPGAESAQITLKTLNFTVTVDPQGLVEELQKVKTALAAQSDEALADPVVQLSNRLQQERQRQQLDLSFLNLAAPLPESMSPKSPAPQPAAIATAASTTTGTVSRQTVLPPQLYPTSPEQTSKRKLELPTFAGAGVKAERAAIATSAAEPVATARSSDVAFETEMDALQSLLVPDDDTTARDRPRLEADLGDGALAADNPPVPPVEDPDLSQATAAVVNGATPEPPAPTALADSDLALLDELSSPVRSAFQALNLQDKFFNRLSSMATDAELATLLKLTLPPTDTPPTAPQLGTEPVAVVTEPPLAIPDLETESSTEVVVDDDPSWREWVKRAGSRAPTQEPKPDPHAASLFSLPPDAAVPVPQLEISTDEIMAGKPINVRVKLPNLLPKIYVKLWINDRQTRTLLDGPRWLVDLLPNGFDELEATTQITAPLGSLNIRLEAIAVEMHTQRESQKVSLDCEVISPEIPDDLFDGFEIL